MSQPESDALIRQLREQISDNDRSIVRALNRRLELVSRLKHYKESRGMEFVDLQREQWIIQDLTRANRGPISPEGLREIYQAIFDLTKREVDRSGESG
jgi:chorismate mutase